jgi:hypothetical protein
LPLFFLLVILLFPWQDAVVTPDSRKLSAVVLTSSRVALAEWGGTPTAPCVARKRNRKGGESSFALSLSNGLRQDKRNKSHFAKATRDEELKLYKIPLEIAVFFVLAIYFFYDIIFLGLNLLFFWRYDYVRIYYSPDSE